MQEHPQNPRISATNAFMESLDQLHHILAQEHQLSESEPPSEHEPEVLFETDAHILDEVAADLEAFFGDGALSEPEELDEPGSD